MEIKILVKENEKAELDKFIETCKEHGMQLTREGGGRLQNFSGHYAEFKGVRWQKDDTGERQSNIPDVSNMLPDGFWFDDEHGTTVTVIGIVDKWCMVEDIEHEEPYVLPLEYVTSIYEESKEGNYC